jgi:glycosyltransferase involved in cell wall biosynthesis
MTEPPHLSIIIPVYNEKDNVTELHEELLKALSSTGYTYEIIFIDDGSRDGTYQALDSIRKADNKVKIIRFQKNFGKSAALSYGFSRARGKVIITMDGDLQDDQKEIPRFLEALDSYDMVSGWKQKRHDPLTKTLPSKIFNWLTRRLTGVNIHDFNCGFKAYRSEVVKNINIYGEMHRYIPAIAQWKGFIVGEVPVDHRPRTRGKSKYGTKRLIRGLLDLITIKFLMSYCQRPLHLFGGIGFLSCGAGAAICSYLLYTWLTGVKIGDRPLLTLGVLLIIIGIQFVAIGLIGELMVSTRDNREWVVKGD